MMSAEEEKTYQAEYYQKNKPLIVARQAVYREENKERILAQQAAWRKKNKEHIAAHAKEYSQRPEVKESIAATKAAWNEKNRVRIAARGAAYREKNKEHIAAHHASYKEQNKERIKAYNAQRYRGNRERILAQNASYREKNKEWVNAKKTEMRRLDRMKFYDMYGLKKEGHEHGVCMCCKERDLVMFGTVSHIDGSGKQHRILTNGQFGKVIKDAIAHYDPAKFAAECACCNMAAEKYGRDAVIAYFARNGGVCPHKVKEAKHG